MDTWHTGQRISKECIACGNEEIWRIEYIRRMEYSDGLYRTYKLISEKHCFGKGVKTYVKDVPQVISQYRLVSV